MGNTLRNVACCVHALAMLNLAAACSEGGAPQNGNFGGPAAAADGGGTAGNGDTSAAGTSGGAGGDGVVGAAGTGAGTGAGPVLGATPGTFVPRADLDPSTTFDWSQSLPGQGTCKPGKYTGTFTCTYTPAGTPADAGAGVGATVVSGPVTLELQKSMSGEFLEIANGQLDGVAQGVIGFTSKLSGKLDCTTLELTADAVDGVYGFGDPKLFPFGVFQGGLTGALDTQTLVLSGNWALTEGSGGTCSGPWMASFTP